ncbi:hypothetical protein [Halomonas sp. BMC6]|uniref:ATP-dependent DNA ligase n=1 Tax=Halomonas sp. BMC6 TaxID=3073244 RepID=UPI0030D0C08C
MTALTAIVNANDEGNIIYCLLKLAKKANKKKRIDLIKDFLANESSSEETKAYQQELIHFLFSPLRVFNVKPKKEWVVGSDSPTKEWSEAHALLLKLERREITGNAAKQAAQAMCAELPTWAADLFKRCLEKRPDAGMTANTINEAIKGYVPQFKCALAEPVEYERCLWPMLIQPKLDGVRVLAHVQISKSTVTYYSRKGLTFSSMEHLTADCLKMAMAFQSVSAVDMGEGKYRDVVLDGEVFGDNFKESISAVRKKDKAATNTKYHLYDWMFADEFFETSCDRKQHKRLMLLRNAFNVIDPELDNIRVVPTYKVASESEAIAKYDQLIGQGFEGAVLKKPYSLYSFRRSYDWMKMKPEESADLMIVGYEEGTGKYEGQIGALIVDFNGVEVSVGSGLTDDLRASLMGERFLGRIIEVAYMEVTPDGSLRHPRFKCFRDLADHPGIKI